MKILVIGNGGREHSIALKIRESESFNRTESVLFCTLGNPGIDRIATPVGIKPSDIPALSDFAVKENIDLTVVGPEVPLSLGIADEFEKNNLRIFGPKQAAAEIETSKIFAKDFMTRHDIPTAKFKSFNSENIHEVNDFIGTLSFPVVIKADGLAAGKGVCIAESPSEASSFISDLTSAKIFGDSGSSFIIEEYLTGFELSVFAITDGTEYVILPTAQDHKRIGEGDTGKNTGGMGSYAPADALIDALTLRKIREEIIEPAIKGMSDEGREYKGCLYCGLMICGTKGNFRPYVIEFNCRFGDPETQAVLPLIKSDFLELLMASAEGKIKDYQLEIDDLFAGCVVAASGGYPGTYQTDKVISGIGEIPDDLTVIHSGTKYSADKKNILTSGGRVMSVVGFSRESLVGAFRKAYKGLEKIHFDNIYYRKDIGNKYYKILSEN